MSERHCRRPTRNLQQRQIGQRIRAAVVVAHDRRVELRQRIDRWGRPRLRSLRANHKHDRSGQRERNGQREKRALHDVSPFHVRSVSLGQLSPSGYPVGDAFRFKLGVPRPLRRRLRDLAPDLHVARHRVPRHARATEVDERARVDRRALPRDDHDLDVVLAELARHAVRRRLQHAGELIDHVLDLPRAHVLTTAAHRFLLPPGVVEETIVILRREVARVEPAVAEGMLGLIRMIQVVVRPALCRAQRELADPACRKLGAVVAEDRRLASPGGLPHRADLAIEVDQVPGRIDHRELLDDADAEPFLEWLPAVRGAPRRQDGPHGVVAVRGLLGLLQKDRDHCTDVVELNGVERAHVVPEAARAEPVPDRELRVEEHRAEDGDRKRVAVEQREAGVDRLARAHVHRVPHREQRRDVRPHRDHALRRPGGSARV